MALILYWRPGTASMAPHAALAEIGCDYELVLVEREQAQTDASYLALNPLGVVPTLVDEAAGRVLTESAAILLHLGDRYPEARLAPADRAEYYRWLVFLTNTTQTALLRFFYPERFGGGDAVAASGASDAQRAFDVVERSLEGREWIAADHRSGADLFLFMLTRWGRRLDPAAWDRPGLRAHFANTLALPGVRRMIDEQGLDLPAWAVPAAGPSSP
jgi:glutathione S-transferase